MNNLYIKGTDHSPEINFDIQNKQSTISGWSRPESPEKFSKSVLQWIDKNGKEHLSEATVHFRIEYFNTPSAKLIKAIFDCLEKLSRQGVKLSVTWNYDDEETKEEFDYEFSSGLNLPIQYIKSH